MQMQSSNLGLEAFHVLYEECHLQILPWVPSKPICMCPAAGAGEEPMSPVSVSSAHDSGNAAAFMATAADGDILQVCVPVFVSAHHKVGRVGTNMYDSGPVHGTLRAGLLSSAGVHMVV